MKTRTITPPDYYPVDLPFLRTQLRQPPVDQDAYLRSLIAAATQKANDYTGRQFNRATLMAYDFYKGSSVYELQRGPVATIVSVIFIAVDGGSISLNSTDYYLIPEEYSAIVVIKAKEKLINIDQTRSDAVRITYTAGYLGEEGSFFPDDVVNAIALSAARMFNNPDDQIDEKTSISDNLLKKYRCPII